MIVTLWVIAVVDLAGVVVALVNLGRMLQWSPATARSVTLPGIGQTMPKAHRVRRQVGSPGPYVLVLVGRNCVGTFRITRHLEDLGHKSGVPVVVHRVRNRYSPANVTPLTAKLPEVDVAYMVPPELRRTPIAFYADGDDVVRQIRLVDNLLSLAHFTEGCPHQAMREWAWTLSEWNEQAQRSATERHYPATTAAASGVAALAQGE